MGQMFKALYAPGARCAVECLAPTQVVGSSVSQDGEGQVTVSVDNVTTFVATEKRRVLDRWLDRTVEISGSELVFFLIMGGLLTWAFMGIPFGKTTDWQVGISDAQAILNLVFDSFLMRQQLNAYDSLLEVAGCLRSRTISQKRMLRALVEGGIYEKVQPTQFQELTQTEFASELPAENWLGRISTAVSNFMGHIVTIVFFWIGIFIWIGFGQYCGWSNTWQLYINSATSGFMVFMLAFLANIRERHGRYSSTCVKQIYGVDATLELRLRSLTGDTMPNQTITLSAPKVNRIQRVIDYYADLVGTLVGIAILFFVIATWAAIGPAMQFNSNWWLLIGTYAGLIGMNDGFVLRNVYHLIHGYEDAHFVQLAYDDLDMCTVIGVSELTEEKVVDDSLNVRVSLKMGAFCSHQYTVVGGLITIIGLVIGASAMQWSVTGQLLCNVPPSIIESFFTAILITGHNIGDARRRVDLHNIYLRRLKLLSYVNTLVKVEKQ